MTIPIHLKLPGADLPGLDEDGMRIVVAEDGHYLERRTPMFATCTRATGRLIGLAPHEESCTLFTGKVPRLMVRAMLAYFRDAYRIHEGEAALVLLYHPERGTFRWVCPDQTVEVSKTWRGMVASDFIRYDMPLEVPDGYVIFGDAHSHADMPARPSGTDKDDEEFKDGLHIIVGRIDRVPQHQYHVDFVMDGQRFNLPPESVLEDGGCVPLAKSPKSWLGKIRLKTRASRPTWFFPEPNDRRGNRSYRDDRDDRRGDNWFA